MKKLILGFDLDSIIVDLIRPWLAWYNDKHEDTVTIDDVKSYKIEKFTTKTDKVFDFFKEVENYRNCPILPGAAEGLKELDSAGHDIIIATATAGQTAHIKWHLVEKAAPWLHENNVMVGSRKELLKFDVFTDDAPKNIVGYRNHWPGAQIMAISYPYNQDCAGIVDCFAKDHNNTHEAWKQMVDHVASLS